jgi:hypothetical protein
MKRIPAVVAKVARVELDAAHADAASIDQPSLTVPPADDSPAWSNCVNPEARR